MNKIILLLTLMAVGGCSIAQYPVKRPMTDEGLAVVKSADVVVNQDHYGVGVSWYRVDSSATGSQYGFIGAIVAATMDAIINAGPSSRASKAAEEVAAAASTDYLNESLVNSLRDASKELSGEGYSVTFDSVNSVVKLEPEDTNKKLTVGVSYLLSQEASQLKVSATAGYWNDQIKYVTPYDFDGKSPPKSELSGAIYLNNFNYYSDTLALPVVSPEIEQELVSQIKERYTDENGKLPVEGSDDFKKYKKEMEEATDGKLSKSEMSIFLIRTWLADDAQLLKQEVKKAHDFFAKSIIQDFHRLDVPSFEGQDKEVEVDENGRRVIIVGSGYGAGGIESRPAAVTEIATWANATQYSKDNLDKVKEIRAANKKN